MSWNKKWLKCFWKINKYDRVHSPLNYKCPLCIFYKNNKPAEEIPDILLLCVSLGPGVILLYHKYFCEPLKAYPKLLLYHIEVRKSHVSHSILDLCNTLYKGLALILLAIYFIFIIKVFFISWNNFSLIKYIKMSLIGIFNCNFKIIFIFSCRSQI